MANKDLGKTQITDNIRVSSAAIFYDQTGWGISYYQYETWIFSDDPKVKSKMFIWGTTVGREIVDYMAELTQRAHRRISKIMIEKVRLNKI